MLTLSIGINSTVSYAKSAKSCPYFSLFFQNLPFHRENSGKWAHLSRCHAKFSLPSRPQTHHEICRRKEQIVLQKVLSDTASCPHETASLQSGMDAPPCCEPKLSHARSAFSNSSLCILSSYDSARVFGQCGSSRLKARASLRFPCAFPHRDSLNHHRPYGHLREPVHEPSRCRARWQLLR